ncbi:MAG: hypothetical protein ACE5HZ_09620, partial [Fidelibacterota bacterium]
MSRSTKALSLTFGVFLIGLAGILFMGARAGAKDEGTEVHRISVVAEGMAFRVERTSGPGLTVSGDLNPTLLLPHGDRVEIEFRNDDPGFIHSFVLKGLKDRSTRDLHYGESEVIGVIIPDQG